MTQELPVNMGAMVSLEDVYASSNPGLSSLPPCLGAAPALRQLHLSDTAIGGLPQEWLPQGGRPRASRQAGGARGGGGVIAVLPALALLTLPPAALSRDPVVAAFKARGVAAVADGCIDIGSGGGAEDDEDDDSDEWE
jgi:hypothetical protein